MTKRDKDDFSNIVAEEIREAAIAQMCAGLLRFGVEEAKVKAAADEARRTNSDKPLMELMKGNPIFKMFARE